MPLLAAPAQAASAPRDSYSPVVPRPAIVNKIMRNATAPKYASDIANYSLRHYGVYTSTITPRAVVLHYTVSDAGSAQGIINWWDQPWAGGSNSGGEQPQPAAHYLIEQDGTIFQTMPDTLMVRHAYGMNHAAIGIEFVERSSASNVLARKAQMDAGIALVRYLMFTYGIPSGNILGHGTANSHPLFFDLTGLRNDHSDWGSGEVGAFRNRIGYVPRKNGGPGPGTVLQLDAGAPGATVVGNLTAASPQTPGWTTMYPCEQGRPLTASSIFHPLRTIPNMAVVRADSRGKVCLYTTSQTHLVWDQYYAGTGLQSYSPVRLANTQAASNGRPAGMLPAGGTLVIDTGASGNSPQGGAAGATVMANLSVAGTWANGYATAYPCEEPVPSTSSINFRAGEARSNFVVVKADSAGKVCVRTTAATHMTWDQSAQTHEVGSHNAERLFDSRRDLGSRIGPLWVQRIKAGAPGDTVVGNLTVTGSDANGFSVAWPCDEPRPKTSVNNFSTRETNANAAMVRTSADGEICLSASTPVHLIWDQVGTTSSFSATSPQRLLDTRK